MTVTPEQSITAPPSRVALYPTPHALYPALGDEVEDAITGFRGIVTGLCFWPRGGSAYVERRSTVENVDTAAAPRWFDVDRLRITTAQAVTFA